MSIDETDNGSEQGFAFEPKKRSRRSFDGPPLHRRVILMAATAILAAAVPFIVLCAWHSIDDRLARITSLIEDGAIRPGMTRQELVELIGEPDDHVTASTSEFEYEISRRVAPRRRRIQRGFEGVDHSIGARWYGESRDMNSGVFEARFVNEVVVEILW